MRLFLSIAGIIFTTLSFAYDVSPFTPNVVDDTHTLSAESIERINQKIDQVKSETAAWPAVYVVDGLRGSSVEEVSEEVFRKWELGKKGSDNGLLFLIALSDRQMRIEVGYGLEGTLTDIFCSSLINSRMVPEFKNQDYEAGIVAALEEVRLKMKGESTIESEMIQGDPDWDKAMVRLKYWLVSIWLIPFLISFLGVVFAVMMKPSGFIAMKKKGKVTIKKVILGTPNMTAVLVKLFVTLNPGVFIVVFPVAFVEDADPMTLIFNTVWFFCAVGFIYASFSFVRQMFSINYFNRVLAKERLALYRSSRSSGSTYRLFGKTYTAPTRSSSSSSSTSSRSSSSGGGRSGGGGASGRW